MGSKPQEAGKLERSVRMDYSDTYRENDRLDVDLDEHIITLTRTAQRALTEKDEELELARVDADKILRLKDAINSKQDGNNVLGVLCLSPPKLGKRTSVSSSGSKRKASTGNLSGRRASVFSNTQNSVNGGEELEENGAEEHDVLLNGDLVDHTRKMSLTERRLAIARERFSSKNLFNVMRKSNSSSHLTDVNANKTEGSQDGLKKATSSVSLSRQHSAPQGQERPRTSPAWTIHQRSRQNANKRGYLRPTTASASRLVRFADGSLPAEDDGYDLYGRPRRPRSRRELEKLSQLNIDPFEDESPERPDSWQSSGNSQQDMLDRLYRGRSQLQVRVKTFLKEMEDFNKKGRKTGLEQILEAT